MEKKPNPNVKPPKYEEWRGVDDPRPPKKKRQRPPALEYYKRQGHRPSPRAWAWIWRKELAGVPEGATLKPWLLKARWVFFPVRMMRQKWTEHYVPFALWHPERGTVEFKGAGSEKMEWTETILTNTMPRGLYLLDSTGWGAFMVTKLADAVAEVLPPRDEVMAGIAREFWYAHPNRTVAATELLDFFRGKATDERLRALRAESHVKNFVAQVAQLTHELMEAGRSGYQPKGPRLNEEHPPQGGSGVPPPPPPPENLRWSDEVRGGMKL